MQAWRRRWFVLRRGRMSGDRDVLEYYRSQRATKPLRAIDLRDCAVCAYTGPGFVRKEFQNQFVFVVKTTARTFYLVAKTEEEMQVWVRSISQVLNLGQLQDATGETQAAPRLIPIWAPCKAPSSGPKFRPQLETCQVIWLFRSCVAGLCHIFIHVQSADSLLLTIPMNVLVPMWTAKPNLSLTFTHKKHIWITRAAPRPFWHM